MAFAILGNPKPAFFDSSGAPLASGTLTIVEPSTDVNKATYPTYDDAEALTNPNDNPITLDARGECDLWGLDGEDYKLTLKDSNGATVWTTDDVFLPGRVFAQTAAESTAGVTPTKLWYEPGNVLKYGAEDGATNNTTEIQNAIDVMAVNGGTVYLPAGTYRGNWTTATDVIIEGAGANATILEPVTNDAVFKTPVTTITNKIQFKKFKISGTVTDSAQDGIVLKSTTASTYVDSVLIEDVFINNCGRYGIHTYGEGSTGPFVQRLSIIRSQANGCADSGLFMEGAAFECSAENSFFTSNGGDAGTNSNVLLTTDGGGSIVSRMNFRSCGFNSAGAIAAGNPTSTVEIVSSREVKFDTCDFEQGDPMIEIRSTARRVTIESCALASSSNATSFILLTSVQGCRISSNTFDCTATVTNYIRQTSATANVDALNITPDNVFSVAGTLTKAVELVQNQQISSGAINAYRTDMLIDVEGGAAGTDDLDTINGIDGGALTLIDGQIISITPFNTARDIVVTNAGNILTNTGASVTLDETYKSFTARWSDGRGKWIQV